MERRRPDPEQVLKQVEAEERRRSRGKLKVFLGYASGVGKSFRMFDEGRRRKLRGEDVVVGATQPRMPPEVEDLVRGFEVITPRGDPGAPAIDVPAVLRRRPRVCLIDGLAYANPPGGKHPQRWQDVEELLAAGITVITSINLQYVKERQNEVEAIRGKVVKDAVPEAFLRTADEIEVVDAPTLAPQFSALREIALLLTAEVVDHQLEEYLRRRGIEQIYGTHERILVCITPRSNAALMIRRGRRQADRFHGDLHVVYVQQDQLSPADRHMLEENLACAREANAHVEILEGEDPTASILEFAARQGITQIFVGHSLQTGWMSRWRINPVERFILEADGIDVRIFPHQDRRHE
jgi:two-component system sensor histidine kinase KdpD